MQPYSISLTFRVSDDLISAAADRVRVAFTKYSDIFMQSLRRHVRPRLVLEYSRVLGGVLRRVFGEKNYTCDGTLYPELANTE
jgi:hypothetical protein